MMTAPIRVTGATHHNLKQLCCEIPRERLVALAGPSGAGKSTLAFDVLHAEGQRRFLQALSVRARRHFDQLPRPAVDAIEGLGATIAIADTARGHSPRSTVGTATELADYLRLLFARAALPHHPDSGVALHAHSVDTMVALLRQQPEGTRFMVGCELDSRDGVTALLDTLRKRGFSRVRLNDREHSLDEAPPPYAASPRVELVVDRLVNKPGLEARLADSLELALREGQGQVRIWFLDGQAPLHLSERPKVGDTPVPIPEPGLFSSLSPRGACSECQGLGRAGDLGPPCPACAGSGLRPEARWFRLNDRSYPEISQLPIDELAAFISQLRQESSPKVLAVSERVLEALERRIESLLALGLSYLTIARPVMSLSGGEAKRVALAAQLGSALSGALYLVEEPTAGLHRSDAARVVAALRALVGQGNTVLVISHDPHLLREVDHVLELGPGAAEAGGHLVASASPSELKHKPESLTGAYLLRAQSETHARVAPSGPQVIVNNASTHNLKSVTASLPVGAFTTVTGVSGSGKSSLILDTLLPALQRHLRRAPAGTDSAFVGLDHFDKLIAVDQQPLSPSPTSCIATYVGALGDLRQLFAALPEARARGFGPGRFSFNTRGGRCEHCKGAGTTRVEMHFLPDAFVDCAVCGGQRFNRETLEVRYRGLAISGVLALSVGEARELLSTIPKLTTKLQMLHRLGLGYVPLGQPLDTLSTGEIQRVKLAAQLARPATGRTLIALDEPALGLHPREVEGVLQVLDELCADGNTILTIEHHDAFVQRADWLLELGPGAGAAGGKVIHCGPPSR